MVCTFSASYVNSEADHKPEESGMMLGGANVGAVGHGKYFQ